MTTPVVKALGEHPVPVSVRRRGSVLATVKIVMWSFVGLCAQKDHEKQAGKINPLHVVFLGLIGIFFFVGGLVLLATWASRL